MLELTRVNCITFFPDDISCFRCEKSYYCEGDGDMKMCGRCDASVVTCDRDPTEYSHGLFSECLPCPDGWVSFSLILQDCSLNVILFGTPRQLFM